MLCELLFAVDDVVLRAQRHERIGDFADVGRRLFDERRRVPGSGAALAQISRVSLSIGAVPPKFADKATRVGERRAATAPVKDAPAHRTSADRAGKSRPWCRGIARRPAHCAPSAPAPTVARRGCSMSHASRVRRTAAGRRRCSRWRGGAGCRRGRCHAPARPRRMRARQRRRPSIRRSVSDVFHGLRVRPNTSLKVEPPAPNSGVFDLAMTMPPLRSMRSTTGCEVVGT